MSGPPEAAKLLRAGVLDGVLVLLAGSGLDCGARAGGDVERRVSSTTAALAPAIGRTCTGLGARVLAWRPGEPVPAEVDVLVFDGAVPFHAPGGLDGDGDATAGRRIAPAGSRAAPAGSRAAPAGSRAALRDCLDGAWEASHAVANAVFIDGRRPGRIVYLAPRSKSAAHADAARAGLENLARTLSIEWARHAITTVAIAPGASTPADDVAALCAYLASPAGEYFSGCLLDLRGPGA